MRSPETVLTPANRWIVSARYDLALFFGGAIASLAILALYFGVQVPIILLWWVWLLGFDGPHIAAAFTRTYADSQEWRTRSRLLLISLLTFAVGPVFLVLSLATHSELPFLLFLALSAFYGYYHIVRQHYGFLALYKAVNRDTGKPDFLIDQWSLYVGCWTPYFYLLLTHPKARELMRLGVAGPRGGLERAAVIGLIVLWVISILVFLGRALSRPRINAPKVAYWLVTVLLYGLIYFFIARFEPTYGSSNGPDQDFLLLSILVTLFHNIQYLGLVWLHNRNRYGGGDPAFGFASTLNRSAVRFLMGCGLFSVVYLLFACWTGVFPRCSVFAGGRIGPFTMSQIGLCLWWGLAINHYYLDQKIWRVRGDPVLKRNLGLA